MTEVNFSGLEIEIVLFLQTNIIQEARGVHGVRDFALLHSAVSRPKATFGGLFLYKDIFYMAAALLHSLVMNHPFLDGNKRTAYATTAYFLHTNGYLIKSTTKEQIDLCVAVDNEGWQVEQIVAWLKNHCVKTK